MGVLLPQREAALSKSGGEANITPAGVYLKTTFGERSVLYW